MRMGLVMIRSDGRCIFGRVLRLLIEEEDDAWLSSG